MDRLDSLVKYFQEKERKKLDGIVRTSAMGIPFMSPEEIRQSCVENNGYEAPELNDKLYLHFRGFRRIENLGPYTACKALWLDSNGFDTIEGLETLTELRCLYLGKNLISRIQGLDSLLNLHTLDLSYNRITVLENLSCCQGLKTLIVARNNLSSADSIRHLIDCPSIDCLDLTNNMLEGDDVMPTLAEMRGLRTLSINGNGVTKQPSFRKRTIAMMPMIGYLDRPVDELERKAAEAFVRGGSEAEAQVREDWRLLQQRKRLNEALVFRAWKAEQVELRRKQAAEGQSLYPAMSEEEGRAKAAAAERDWEEEQLALGRLREASSKASEKNDKEVTEGTPHAEIEPSSSHEVAAPEDVHIETEADTDRAYSEPNLPPVESVADKPLPDVIVMAKKVEEEERAARQRLVDESFAIFKKQRETERRKFGGAETRSSADDTPQNDLVVSHSTWDAALNAPDAKATPFRVSLYWTLEMDLKLSMLVRECAFDFDKIFLKMISAASDGTLGDIPKPAIALISSDACRIRWCELDAARWSELAPDATSTDAVYRICIDPAEVSDGKGGQLSFDQLAAKSAGEMPRYLIPPKSFPSVRDDESDSAGDDEDEDSEGESFRATALKMKNRQ